MNLEMHVWLEDFHDTATSPSMKTYSIIDFECLVSNIQLPSLYLFVPLDNWYNATHNPKAYVKYLNTLSIVFQWFMLELTVKLLSLLIKHATFMWFMTHTSSF